MKKKSRKYYLYLDIKINIIKEQKKIVIIFFSIFFKKPNFFFKLLLIIFILKKNLLFKKLHKNILDSNNNRDFYIKRFCKKIC